MFRAGVGDLQPYIDSTGHRVPACVPKTAEREGSPTVLARLSPDDAPSHPVRGTEWLRASPAGHPSGVVPEKEK